MRLVEDEVKCDDKPSELLLMSEGNDCRVARLSIVFKALGVQTFFLHSLNQSIDTMKGGDSLIRTRIFLEIMAKKRLHSFCCRMSRGSAITAAASQE